MISAIKGGISILMLAVLAGCTSMPLITTEPPVSENMAVIDLLDEARNQSWYGEYNKSKATLERALRLEPNNAHIWFELARVNHENDDPASARNLAQRARSLSKSERLSRRIDNFIAEL